MFLHLTLKVGYNSRKFGMTLSGRSYIMFLQLPVESNAARLTAVSIGQVKSKDMPQMVRVRTCLAHMVVNK